MSRTASAISTICAIPPRRNPWRSRCPTPSPSAGTTSAWSSAPIHTPPTRCPGFRRGGLRWHPFIPGHALLILLVHLLPAAPPVQKAFNDERHHHPATDPQGTDPGRTD